MTKKFTLLLLSIMLIASATANAQSKAFRNQSDKNSASVKPCFNRGGVIEKSILTEDFSKFTEGDESEPDYIRLDDADGVISDEYFNTPGWSGNEIYQIEGCAYIGFSEEYQEPGIIITPLINTSGAIYINCRVRTIDPEGDVIGYNIISEDKMDLFDANVDFFRATNEWTEISWFTSAGAENTHVYIFAYSKNIFIDDIEIISLSLPAPTLLEETNIESNNFTANWEAVDDADTYIFRMCAQHTAEADETFYYSNTSFDDVTSNGTIASPEIIDDMDATIDNWHIFMPALINEAIGFSGQYASSEVFGAITSSVTDMSSNNGKVNLSFKALTKPNTEIIVSLINSEYGYYDIADQVSVFVEKEGWNEYSFELREGNEDTYIEITSFSSSNIFFDDIKLYQTIKGGEIKNLIIDELLVKDTCHKSQIDKSYINDSLYYQVAARKNVYSSSNKIIGTIDSEFTEAKGISLNKDTEAPESTITVSVPQNLFAIAVDTNSVALSWTSAQNATSYNVYIGTEKLENVTTTSYLVENLEAGTEYCFSITAVNDKIESEKSAEACAKTMKGEGIEEFVLNFNIYPNPIKNALCIASEEIIEEVTIYNIYGQQVYNSQFTIHNSQFTIDVESLTSGTYFIKVNETVKKFIKQ